MNRHSLLFSSPIWMPFTFFFLCLARTSVQYCVAVVSRLPCHVPDLRKKAFSLSPLSIMLTVSFSKNVLYRVEEVPFSLNFLCVCVHTLNIMKGCWILSNVHFSTSIEVIGGFIFFFFYFCGILYWLTYIEPLWIVTFSASQVTAFPAWVSSELVLQVAPRHVRVDRHNNLQHGSALLSL